MIKLLWVMVCMVGISSAVLAEFEQPVIEEFYLGHEIKVIDNKPLQQFDIPFEVYKNVTSTALNDIRVFNASSSLVPHKIFTRPQDTQITLKPIEISKLVKDSQDIERLINKYQATGLNINLNLQANDWQDKDAHQDIYIAEVGDVEGNHAELILDWKVERDTSYFFTADIEMANDLENWKTIAKQRPLAQLKISDGVVRHNKIKLNQFNNTFYRITIKGEHRPEINSAKLKIRNKVARIDEVTEEIPGIHDRQNKQHIYYQMSAPIPIKQVQVLIEEDNVVVKCHVYSRQNEDQAWQMRGSGVVYRIKQDTEALTHQTIDVSASSHPFWKIELQTAGSGFEQQAPLLKFHWRPHTLSFVARGKGPFTLAIGSAKYTHQPANQNTLFQDVNNGKTDQMIGVPRIDVQSKVLGGESVLKETPTKITLETILLWSILVMGSVLLLWMAFSLLRNHSNNGDG